MLQPRINYPALSCRIFVSAPPKLFSGAIQRLVYSGQISLLGFRHLPTTNDNWCGPFFPTRSIPLLPFRFSPRLQGAAAFMKTFASTVYPIYCTNTTDNRQGPVLNGTPLWRILMAGISLQNKADLFTFQLEQSPGSQCPFLTPSFP